MKPGIDRNTYEYLKQLQHARQRRRERAWLTGGIIAAAALIIGTALGAFYATGAW